MAPERFNRLRNRRKISATESQLATMYGAAELPGRIR